MPTETTKQFMITCTYTRNGREIIEVVKDSSNNFIQQDGEIIKGVFKLLDNTDYPEYKYRLFEIDGTVTEIGDCKK